MVFRYGKIPDQCKTFLLQGKQLEIVSEFRYLGTIFTPQLTYSKHVENLIVKAKSKIGVIFARTPIKDVDIELAMKLFECYVQPIFEFNMIIWTSNYAKSLDERINVVLMSLLKRYCQFHPKTRNSLLYFITGTKPLSQTLHERAITQKDQLTQLNEGLGLDLDDLLIIKERQRTPPEAYEIIKQIPSEFWWQNIKFVKLPANSINRRKLSVKLVDGEHRTNCIRTHFHLESDITCIFKMCGHQLVWYHQCVTVDTPVVT